MRVRYGSWTSDSGEVTLTTRRVPVFADNGLQTGVTETWTINGTVIGNGPAALLAKLTPIEAAFSQHYQTLTLLTDSGQTLRQLNGITPLGGTRVIEGPSYPNSGENDAEWATKREWMVQVEGTYQIANLPSQAFYTFTETIRVRGGGPRRVMLEPAVGAPVVQTVKQLTHTEVTQQGTATGASAALAVPPPIFGAASLWEPPDIARSCLQPAPLPGTGVLLPQFQVTWNYLFRSPTPLLFSTPGYWGS